MITVISKQGILIEVTFTEAEAFHIHKLLKMLFNTPEELPFEIGCEINNILTAIAHPYFSENKD